MKKVACLYRVSTIKQVVEDDIPMQRNACLEFIRSKHDWVFADEYLEKGVSGFRKGLQQRDVLQKVKDDALENKFEILLVFMFDRIGRKTEETPFIIKWLTEQGIEVWSVNEGQQKFDEHIDDLLNYIRSWQSEGESKKTAIRVREKQTQMIKEGRRTGGIAPFGFRLELTDTTNNKGVLLHEQVIDDKEAEVVRLMFNFAYYSGFGGLKIASELNERGIFTRNNKQWDRSKVNSILRNPIYKGFLAYGKNSYKGVKGRQNPKDWLLSEAKNEKWAIIDEYIWNRVQEIRNARTNEKMKTDNYDYNNPHNIPKNTNSPLLLTGMMRCGYCGGTMTTCYNIGKWTTKDGQQHKKKYPEYRCRSKSLGKMCGCNKHYRANLIDKTVLTQIFCTLEQFSQKDYSREVSELKKKNLKIELNETKIHEKQIKKLNDDLEYYKDEIINVIKGESPLSRATIANLIADTNNDILEKQKELINLQSKLKRKELEIDYEEKIPNWKEQFENSTTEIKKMLLTEIIDEVIIKDKEISVKLKGNVIEKNMDI
jgi:DNA invertase Pin-like site-specific DNA recombinase